MIPTSSVSALMGLYAFAVSTGDDKDVAVALDLVADRPAFDLRTPRGDRNNMYRRRQGTFPGALPVAFRHRGATGQQEQRDNEQSFHATTRPCRSSRVN